jgi:hypothetical protein
MLLVVASHPGAPLLPQKQVETVSRRGVLPGVHLHMRLLL